MKGVRGRCEKRGLRSERSREQSRGERLRHASSERERERERHVVERESSRTRECDVAGCASYIEALEGARKS